MSQLPPPLPQQEPPAMQPPPPPPPPLPLPVQPIGYGTPRARSRPGLLTAIGVLSIVIGVCGIMFNATLGVTSFGIMIASQASKAIATAAASPGPGPVLVEDEGMSLSQRRLVINALGQLQPLSPARRRQLDAILVEGGDRMFPGGQSGLAAASIRNNVSDSGRLPDAGGGDGPDFFILGRGRLELSDTHAVFYPIDGREPIRAQATEGEEANVAVEGDVPVEADAGLEDVAAATGSPLTANQLQAAIQHIQTMIGSQAAGSNQKPQLTAAQIKTLRGRFVDPKAGFFTPARNIAGARGQIVAAIALPDGSVMVSTRTGNMQVDAAGKVTSSFTFTPAAARRTGMASVNAVAVLLSMVGAAAGVALAIYLIVIGSLVLRQHPKGARLHRIYAWLKIPLTVGCTLALIWMFASLSGNAAAGPRPIWHGRAMMFGITLVVLGCAYPIGLLLALRSRSLRDYYNSTVTSGANEWGR